MRGRRISTGNADPKIAIMRKATTAATTAHGQGGRRKTRNAPKPVTVASLKFMQRKEGDDG